MNKRIRVLFTAIILMAFTIIRSYQPAYLAKAAQELTINVHYHRSGKDYEGWNIWSWPNGEEGSAYEFTGEDEFGKVATYTLAVEDDTTQVGFIIRHSTSTNDWDMKDVESDRFIDIKKAKNGAIDIYVVQDEMEFGYTREDISLAPKIKKAVIKSSNTIDFKVSNAFDSTASDIKSKITVKDADGKTYAVDKVSSQKGKEALEASITMSTKLDLLKNYTLAFEGYGEMAISNTKVFSTAEFEEAFTYEGDDLGAIWSKEKTDFRLWAPTASDVVLNLYSKGSGNNNIEKISMTKDVKGTWVTEKPGDLNGVYYTYSVTVDGVTKEAVDPYARAAGVNGKRGMIIDLASTNPDGFLEDEKPALVSPTDSIIYELHIRDFSIDKSSGIQNKGKYLAFTETGTKSFAGEKTGVDYLVDLGITHVHLLPSFDYASVDESKPEDNQFNWGYDPENYNVPEGSYSTDPGHGEVRINEYKQMVQSLHKNGIRIIMDVVYNHTSSSMDSNLNKVVPNYYYRMNEDGTFSNASACGNETASERTMVRKYIVDSVVYWAKEYHVDGFRFDLMGIHDIQTMNEVRKALNEVDPTILIYGEGWTAGSSPLPDEEKALKANVSSLDTGIGAFSDDIRDGIKGSVFEAMEQGFVNGKAGMEEIIKFGVVASTEHRQIDYDLVNYSDTWWAKEPTQTITYASAHDNYTLWDKLAISNETDSEEDRIKMNLLSGAIVLTSQGIPFFQAGEEFLRSKPSVDGTSFVDNSYNSPDSVNSLKWDTLTKNKEVFNYYKGLIAFRKAHSALRMTKKADIQENLKFLEGLEPNVVGYTIDNSPNREMAKSLCVIYNANKEISTITIPEGEWNVYVKGQQAGTEVLETVSGGTITVEPISTMVLVQEDKKADTSMDTADHDQTQKANSSTSKDGQNNKVIMVTTIVLTVVAVIVAAYLLMRKKKTK